MKSLPDKIYIEMLYYVRTGKKLNLSDHKSFNGKLNWMKLYDRNPIYSDMADKYKAKRIVRSKWQDIF